MAYKDLHDEPFDDTTVAKLEIFEDYAQAWLPTFIMSGQPHICVFDFFAGTGYDKNGVAGSPIRILTKIDEQIGNIFQKKVKIDLYLNEFEPHKKEQNKFALLVDACTKFLNEHPKLKHFVNIEYSNKDFEEVFPILLPTINTFPSLVYLDQNGIKFLSAKYFLELEKTKQTDLLYFVSASYFWRFGETKEFKVHLDIDMVAAKEDPYKFIHRNIIDQLRKKLPQSSTMKLYPYSLKKGTNIYGIIFGAKHVRAVDKFLTIAWKRNDTNGEANFDIHDDQKKGQLSFFEPKKLTKLEQFQMNVRGKVLAGEITNNLELFYYSLDEGHLGSHASACLMALKKEGLINFPDRSPLINYDSVVKNKRIVNFTILKK